MVKEEKGREGKGREGKGKAGKGKPTTAVHGSTNTAPTLHESGISSGQAVAVHQAEC